MYIVRNKGEASQKMGQGSRRCPAACAGGGSQALQHAPSKWEPDGFPSLLSTQAERMGQTVREQLHLNILLLHTITLRTKMCMLRTGRSETPTRASDRSHYPLPPFMAGMNLSSAFCIALSHNQKCQELLLTLFFFFFYLPQEQSGVLQSLRALHFQGMDNNGP